MRYDLPHLCDGVVVAVLWPDMPERVAAQPAFKSFCADLVHHRKLLQRARLAVYFLRGCHSLLSSFTIS